MAIPALLLSQTANAQQNDPVDVAMAWSKCVTDKSVAWAKLNEPAETVVTGAFGSCIGFEQLYVEAIAKPPYSLPYEDGRKSIDSFRPKVRMKAIAAILTKRANP